MIFSFLFAALLVAESPFTVQTEIDIPVLPAPPQTCREVIGYSLQDQGSRFFSRTRVITALESLTHADTITRSRTNDALRLAIPSDPARTELVRFATVAIAEGKASGLCETQESAIRRLPDRA